MRLDRSDGPGRGLGRGNRGGIGRPSSNTCRNDFSAIVGALTAIKECQRQQEEGFFASNA
jgi:hypothetical protein